MTYSKTIKGHKYLYKSVRIDGKVKNIYMGKPKKALTKNETLLLVSITFMVVFMAGGICNFLVIIHNGGNMPAKNVDAFGHENYIDYNESTANQIEYEPLADRLGFDYNGYNYRFSVGDVLLMSGIIGLGIPLIWFCIRKEKGYD